MAFPVKYAVPQQALLTILTVLAWQSHCLTDDGLFCNSNDLMSSGSVTNVTGTLSRMRNTFCWTVRMNSLFNVSLCTQHRQLIFPRTSI